jgi:superfamily II DNA or RNA helicase
MKGISSTNSKSINTKIHRNPLLSVGRWILSAHQKQTVEFFIKRGRRMIIADTWNMGKTVTSLACTQMSGAKKILVIVPKQLICHWAWHINQISFSMSSQPTGKNSHSKFSNK